MAFEKINECTIQLADKYKKLEERILNEPDEMNRKRMRSQCTGIFDSLVIYYETTLQTAKFRAQRDYCKQVLSELNPAFSIGYFSKPKKK